MQASTPGNYLNRHRLFVYGTLQLPERVRSITGRALSGIPAQLDGYRCGLVARADFPGMVPDAAQHIHGQLLQGLSQVDLLRLDQYEGELYRRIRVNVWAPCGKNSRRKIAAWAYVIAPWARQRVTVQAWSVDWYRRQPKRLTYRN